MNDSSLIIWHQVFQRKGLQFFQKDGVTWQCRFEIETYVLKDASEANIFLICLKTFSRPGIHLSASSLHLHTSLGQSIPSLFRFNSSFSFPFVLFSIYTQSYGKFTALPFRPSLPSFCSSIFSLDFLFQTIFQWVSKASFAAWRFLFQCCITLLF